MTLLFDECILEHFEDLLGDDDIETINLPTVTSDDSFLDDDDTMIKNLDAHSLTLKDLLHEMEIRNLQPRGFFDDDAKMLQQILDKEHEEYLEMKRKEKLEARELEASQAMIRRKKALLEIQLGEEEREIELNRRLDQWFCLMKNRCPPSSCTVDVNDVSARTLARMLWSDSIICSLDVCNMNISDSSGAYLARALKNNRSIVKVEMSENRFGHKTCTALADALRVNTTLKYLSIGSNPLTIKNNKASVEALVTIVLENKSIRHLGLWRCNIGNEGGREICDAMQTNNTITCLELGYNFWDFSVIQKIEEVIRKNRLKYEEEKKKMMSLKAKQMEEALHEKRELEQQIKKKADIAYIDQQRLERSELRRKNIERNEVEARRDEEKHREEKALKLLEEEEVKKKSKKKKKKKGNKVRRVSCT